jgi:hypothetical protein
VAVVVTLVIVPVQALILLGGLAGELVFMAKAQMVRAAQAVMAVLQRRVQQVVAVLDKPMQEEAQEAPQYTFAVAALYMAAANLVAAAQCGFFTPEQLALTLQPIQVICNGIIYSCR